MTIKKSTFAFLLFVRVLIHQSYAQDPLPYTIPEHTILNIIQSDSISDLITYLPKSYRFNINNPDYNYSILLKSGKNNYLLQDGSNQVHRLENVNGKPKFMRIDSTVFGGDNFANMAFLRKDTLYQYGGYGFWRNRDFFTRYRPNTHDWEFLSGGNGLQNTLTFNFFSRAEDAFYVVGSNNIDAHRHFIPLVRDSLYRYDFKSKNWTTLGRFDLNNKPIINEAINNQYFAVSPFGLIDYETIDLRLWDFSANRIFFLKQSIKDQLYPLAKKGESWDKKYRLAFHLKDTFYLIFGKESDAFVYKTKLLRSDFETSSGIQIYTPRTNSFSLSIMDDPLQSVLLAFGILAFVLLMAYYGRRRLSPATAGGWAPAGPPGSPRPDPQPGQKAVNPGKDHAAVPDLVFFSASLAPIEKDLLIHLIQATLKGEKLDASAINRILGVSGKEHIVQKARRSTTITNINNSFSKIMKQPGQLVIRVRDLSDKRSFLYVISAEHLEQVKAIAEA